MHLPTSGATSPNCPEAKRAEKYPFAYFWNRKVWVTPFDTILLNFDGYRKRIGKAVMYSLAFIISCACVAAVTAILLDVVNGIKGSSSPLLTTVSTAAGISYPVFSDDTGIHTTTGASTPEYDTEDTPEYRAISAQFDSSIFLLCLIEVCLISIVSMIFSGAIPELFLTPVNCLKLARFATIHQRNDGKWALSVRLWICLPQDVYLHDVSISVNYYHKGRYSHASLDASSAQAVANHICDAHYSMIRGVWEIDIPIDTDEGNKLFQLLDRGDNNPSVQYIVQGSTSSGEIISKTAVFDLAHIVIGYQFAPYSRERFCEMRNVDESIVSDSLHKYYDFGAFGKLEKDLSANLDALEKHPSIQPWLHLLSCTSPAHNINSFVQEGSRKWAPKLSFSDWRFLSRI